MIFIVNILTKVNVWIVFQLLKCTRKGILNHLHNKVGKCLFIDNDKETRPVCDNFKPFLIFLEAQNVLLMLHKHRKTLKILRTETVLKITTAQKMNFPIKDFFSKCHIY